LTSPRPDAAEQYLNLIFPPKAPNRPLLPDVRAEILLDEDYG
jgi:hypothetical protein